MDLYEKLSKSSPQMKRGRVWCMNCGLTYTIDTAKAFRLGWPTHCGSTMTVDSPKERKALIEAIKKSGPKRRRTA